MSRGTPALIAWLSAATLLLISLFSPFVTLFDLRPAAEGVPDGLLHELFYSLLHALDRRRSGAGETALGYTSDALAGDDDAGFGVIVNPAKSRTFEVQVGDRVVVVADT